MLFAVEDLRRTLADALGTLTADKPPVIEKKAQQVQIVRSELFAQEKVVAQSAVEILDDRAGPHGGVDEVGDLLFEGNKALSQVAAQGAL